MFPDFHEHNNLNGIHHLKYKLTKPDNSKYTIIHTILGIIFLPRQVSNL